MKTIELTQTEVETKQITTGIPKLDEYLDSSFSFDAQVYAFVIAEICLNDERLGNLIRDYLLENHVKRFDEPGAIARICKEEGQSLECAGELEWWLSFWQRSVKEPYKTSMQADKPKYTDAENEIARRCQIEPEAVRRLGNMIGANVADMLQEAGKKNPEAVENEGQVDSCKQSIDLVRRWFLNQDYKTKLACVILSGIALADHNTNDLYMEIINQYESDVLRIANEPNADISHDEAVMTGLAAELLIWSNLH